MPIHPNSGARVQAGSTNQMSREEYIAKHSGRQQYISKENPNKLSTKLSRFDESVSQKLQDVHSGTVEFFQDPGKALREMFRGARPGQ